MLSTLDAITQRRSVKHYDSAYQFTDNEIDQLMQAAVLSPTSFNIQNWRFVLVRDTQLRKQICEAAWSQSQITDASLLIVMTADLRSWQKNVARYWQNAAPDIQQRLVPMIGQFYEGNNQLQRDEAMRSCGIAAQTIMLTAKAMGYDSCPMIGFDSDAVAKLINLPDDHVIGLLISVGKATKPANPRGGQLPLDEVVVHDRF